jgi:DNA repair photolyase
VDLPDDFSGFCRVVHIINPVHGKRYTLLYRAMGSSTERIRVMLTPQKGRGATLSPDNRFSDTTREVFDDGWDTVEEPVEALQTTLSEDSARSIISYNSSPDVPFDRSINPYRGCEHGCVYCFARPSHAFLDLSPGLDFESRLFYKPDAPKLLRKELANKRYRCAPVMVGINTDAYQPIERKTGLTRDILEVLVELEHPFSIVTKSSLIERDMDLISLAAERGQAQVAVSVTTLDRGLSRLMEPRAAAPQRRIETIRRLTEAGIPVSVLVAPLIPVLTDSEMETILETVREAGACSAGYVLLRLPHEVREMFWSWLQQHYPLKAAHVMKRMRDLHGGRAYNAHFGTLQRGTGLYAELIANRFRYACNRLEFPGMEDLDCSRFRHGMTPQLDMFIAAR